MSNSEFSREELTALSADMRRMFRSLRHGAHADSTLEGIQKQQFWVLGALREGPRRMSDLASCAEVSQASLTAIVDRLEEQGLAQRLRASDDRRVIEVALTDEGRAAKDRATEGMLQRLDEVLAPLSSDERREFARLFAIVASEERDRTC